MDAEERQFAIMVQLEARLEEKTMGTDPVEKIRNEQRFNHQNSVAPWPPYTPDPNYSMPTFTTGGMTAEYFPWQIRKLSNGWLVKACGSEMVFTDVEKMLEWLRGKMG